jgi:maltose/moltooligosaccharide transporter
MTEKPPLGFAKLWNISFGFFGIQIAFALQNANVSRIFQSLGSSIDDLSFLWIAGPVTGLLVQPLVGHYSDRTWGRWGRRRPYFFIGALLAALALCGMPNANILLAAALLLWVLDASLNIAMEPFRAFVGDSVGPRQQTAGYAFQTAFIGAGAVVGSIAPYVLTAWGVESTAPPGEIPDAVRWSFYIGGAAIFLAVLWTVLTAEEYSPDELRQFSAAEADEQRPVRVPGGAPWWILAGVAIVAAVATFELDKPVYILGGTMILFGMANLVAGAAIRAGRTSGAMTQILSDLSHMPPTMRRLAVVQFFTWSALFILWIYTTPVVTQHVYGTTDTASAAYNEGANWVGILFGIYNAVAAVAAFLLPVLARRIGAPATHVVGLLAGAAGFALFLVVRDANLLILPMVLIGIAWSSILTMPYAILAGALPPAKLGIYMGLFNIFVVLPQLIVSTVMGQVMRSFFPTEPVWTMAIGAGVMCIAAAAMLRVPQTSSRPVPREITA